MKLSDVMFPGASGKLEIVTTLSFLEKLEQMAKDEGITVADIVRKSVDQYGGQRAATFQGGSGP